MGLKGNLLYNGDFETGTTEGWICGAFGRVCECSFEASEEAKLRGNYGGLLTSQADFGDAYLAYNKTCSFEEYEGYLFIMLTKMISGYVVCGQLWGLDDKGNLIDDFLFGYNNETGIWRTFVALLRGYKNITHFQVGLWYWAGSAGDKCYFDEVKLIPLKSIRGHEIKEYRFFDNVTANKKWYSVIACVGKCKLRTHLAVRNVSGTSPTLDTKITVAMFEGVSEAYKLTHSQFTSEDEEEKIIDLPECCFISIEYTLGGTDPSFDIYHTLTLEPY